MAVRISMADLILQVRTLIGDSAGIDQALTDQEIQNGLDVHRWEARYMPLKGLSSYENGYMVKKFWVAPFGHWESDVELVDTQYGSLIPSAADNISGRWAFDASQVAVMCTGWSYDLYGAAADLLDAWAAKLAVEFDFVADGAEMMRSQKSIALREMAKQYRSQQKMHIISQVRSDMY